MSRQKKVITGIPLRRKGSPSAQSRQLPPAHQMLGGGVKRYGPTIGFLSRAYPRIAYAVEALDGDDGSIGDGPPRGFAIRFAEWNPETGHSQQLTELTTDGFASLDAAFLYLSELRKAITHGGATSLSTNAYRLGHVTA